MKIVEAAEARERLDTKTCIALMREALMSLEKGGASQPPRSKIGRASCRERVLSHV